MADNLNLSPPPDSGWVYQVQELRVGGQTFCAMIQVKEPLPPQWWEEIYDNPQVSHGLTLITFLVVGGKRIWNAWKGK